MKLAITADEAIAHADGKPLAITGSELWRQTHLSRSQSDAILTTAATITADNPALTVRWPHCRSKPLYIIDRKLQTPLSARLFHSGARIVLFYDQTLLPSRCEPYQALGVTCIGVNCDKMGLNLHEIVNIIGQQGCHELWIEAGGINAESWLREELVDELHLYQNTALWMPGSKPAFPKIYSKASLLKMAPSLSAHSFGSEWCYKLCLKPSKEE